MIQDRRDPLSIQFVHSAPTPHNNYLLDAVAGLPNVNLYRHYLLAPTEVPGRPWKGMSSGEVQPERIHAGYGTRFDWRLVKLALFDRKSVFFVIGWDYPVLVLMLLILGIRKRPLIMWDDGPSSESLELFIKQAWRPRQAIKRLLIALINRTRGTYFHTGVVTRDGILALGIRPEKLVSLPFFVRPGRPLLSVREQHRCLNPCTFILAGGRLMHQKGYDVFVKALGLLRQHGVGHWRAVLIGSGSEKANLLELTKSLGVADDLDFVDWAEPDLFASYVHTCDVFVAPARFDHFPTTVIGAMQAGVAVLATDQVGSAVEFIRSGVNGIITPSGDAQAMADALKLLIQDPASRSSLASAGQRTMQQWPVERGARLIVKAAEEAFDTCAAW